MKMYTKRTPIKASKDYADLKGMDFTKARDLLTKDGFHEHEYGDKDNNNGYAVYRKGDQEVELQYRWIPGKRKGDAHAGKVTNVYVDDNIYGACGKKSVKASNEGRSDLIYVIMVNGNPVAKGSYDAMVKKSYTYNYPVQMLKFPKAKLNSLIKMAKDAHRPDPLKFAVNRFINDNTSEYDSLNSATKVRSRRSIKASGRQLMFPFIVEGEFADGYTCEVGGNSEAECIEKLGNMEDKHGELVWYSGATDENYEAGKSVYSSSNLRSVTASAQWDEYTVVVNGKNLGTDEAGSFELAARGVMSWFSYGTIITVSNSRGETKSYEIIKVDDSVRGYSDLRDVTDRLNDTYASTKLCKQRVMASNYNPEGFAVTGYYDSNYRGVADDRYFDPNELDEAAFYAHDLLSKGLCVNIIYWRTGDKVNITPDEYFDNFDGDFWCTRELVEFRDIVQNELADAVWDIQHGDVESSVCASTSNQIPYDMVSTLVILRDYANVEDEDYINNEHKLLVDIADTLYNVGRGMVTNLSGEYKNLYEMYGEDYFDKVLDDVAAIDSQINDQNLNDLIEDYNNKIAAY